MLIVFIIITINSAGETFGMDEYVYDIGCGDSWMYIYLQTHQVLCIKYIQPFVFQLHLNIVAEKNSLKMRPSICVYQALQVILVDAEA